MGRHGHRFERRRIERERVGWVRMSGGTRCEGRGGRRFDIGGELFTAARGGSGLQRGAPEGGRARRLRRGEADRAQPRLDGARSASGWAVGCGGSRAAACCRGCERAVRDACDTRERGRWAWRGQPVDAVLVNSCGKGAGSRAARAGSGAGSRARVAGEGDFPPPIAPTGIREEGGGGSRLSRRRLTRSRLPHSGCACASRQGGWW